MEKEKRLKPNTKIACGLKIQCTCMSWLWALVILCKFAVTLRKMVHPREILEFLYFYVGVSFLSLLTKPLVGYELIFFFSVVLKIHFHKESFRYRCCLQTFYVGTCVWKILAVWLSGIQPSPAICKLMGFHTNLDEIFLFNVDMMLINLFLDVTLILKWFCTLC